MASNFAFSPEGPCILVDNTARYIQQDQRVSNSWRVKNLSSSSQYFTWGPTSSVTSAGAPVAGTPSSFTIGMLPNSVEIFTNLGPWVIASSSTGFEFIPGDGV